MVGISKNNGRIKTWNLHLFDLINLELKKISSFRPCKYIAIVDPSTFCWTPTRVQDSAFGLFNSSWMLEGRFCFFPFWSKGHLSSKSSDLYKVRADLNHELKVDWSFYTKTMTNNGTSNSSLSPSLLI